nr:vacuolar cation/proton exchanger 3-like [Ipomoea batatas]
MGSFVGTAVLELENENTVAVNQKMLSVDDSPRISSFYTRLDDLSYKYVLNGVVSSIKLVFLSKKLNLLVPCGPLAVIVDLFTNHHGWIFFLSLLGIIPLAERLGWVTEQLAFYTGPTVGGLLNATFGNATELIISMYALNRGMIRVVQQSLLGSILSNMLLVLGSAFFAGGIAHSHKEQVFNKGTAVMNSGLLLMAVMGLLLPAVLHFTHTEMHFGTSELALSRFSSCVMLVAYGAYIFFQLTSERSLYVPIAEEDSQNDGDSDDEEGPEISKWESVTWLFVLTVLITVLSEYLVNAIEDISLGVAIGSSTQIAMFGIPFSVVVGWITGQPMNLDFQLFETATLFMSVLVVAFMLQEGTSNYFKGLMLLLCYLIVAASFFVHIDPETIRDEAEKP